MRRRSLDLLVAVLAALFAGLVLGGPAQAAEDVGGSLIVPVDEDDQAVVELDNADGKLEGSLSLANPGGSAVPVTLDDLGGCQVSVSPTEIGAGTQVSATFTVTGCDLPEAGTVVTLVTAGADGVALLLKAKADPEPVDLWLFVRVFGGVLVVSAVVVFLVCGPGPLPTGSGSGPLDLVSGAPASWSFKDSWISNVSIGSAAFVAFFAAEDHVAAIFGSGAEDLTAKLLLVSGIAALVVAIAPIVAGFGAKEDKPRRLSVLAAATLTLASVGGQVIGVLVIYREADPGGDNLAIATAVAVAVLCLVGVVALTSLYKVLWVPPLADPPTATDAMLIAAAIVASDHTGSDSPGRVLAREYLERETVKLPPPASDEIPEDGPTPTGRSPLVKAMRAVTGAAPSPRDGHANRPVAAGTRTSRPVRSAIL